MIGETKDFDTRARKERVATVLRCNNRSPGRSVEPQLQGQGQQGHESSDGHRESAKASHGLIGTFGSCARGMNRRDIDHLKPPVVL